MHGDEWRGRITKGCLNQKCKGVGTEEDQIEFRLMEWKKLWIIEEGWP